MTLAASNYTLDTLITHLRDLFQQKLATSPSWLTQGFMPMILPEGATGQLFISNVNVVDTGNFYIWSDSELRKESFYYAWTAGAYNVSFPGSCNRLLKNFKTQVNSPYNSFKSGFIDLLTHHTIYIRSPQLGTFQNIGPQGERDILKKVMVTVPFGDLITDHWLNTEDFTDCSRLTLKTRFRVTDVYGVPINLHGHHISFSLVFISSQ